MKQPGISRPELARNARRQMAKRRPELPGIPPNMMLLKTSFLQQSGSVWPSTLTFQHGDKLAKNKKTCVGRSQVVTLLLLRLMLLHRRITAIPRVTSNPFMNFGGLTPGMILAHQVLTNGNQRLVDRHT